MTFDFAGKWWVAAGVWCKRNQLLVQKWTDQSYRFNHFAVENGINRLDSDFNCFQMITSRQLYILADSGLLLTPRINVDYMNRPVRTFHSFRPVIRSRNQGLVNKWWTCVGIFDEHFHSTRINQWIMNGAYNDNEKLIDRVKRIYVRNVF